MKEGKYTVRYLGFHALSDGGRGFEFAFSRSNADLQLVSVEASLSLLSGPGHMAIQECAGICYETLKCLVANGSETMPASISLTSEDVAQHRKQARPNGRR